MTDMVEKLIALTGGDPKWKSNASEMSQPDVDLAKLLDDSGYLGNYGSATTPGGTFLVTIDGAIAMGSPPDWYVEMSPHERATHKAPWMRTEQDYLTILSERPDAWFSEYDNTSLLFSMIDSGLLRLRKDKPSTHTSMCTSLNLELTPEGMAALKERS